MLVNAAQCNVTRSGNHQEPKAQKAKKKAKQPTKPPGFFPAFFVINDKAPSTLCVHLGTSLPFDANIGVHPNPRHAFVDKLIKRVIVGKHDADTNLRATSIFHTFQSPVV